MTRAEIINFELMIMDLVEAEEIAKTSDYEKVSQLLHESIENAMQDYCMDNGIDDYEPQF